MPLSDESTRSIRSRVNAADMQVNLDVILGWIDIIKTKRDPEDIDGALDLLASLTNMFRTLVQDLNLLLVDREELVGILCDYAEQLKIYDELEKLRSGL